MPRERGLLPASQRKAPGEVRKDPQVQPGTVMAGDSRKGPGGVGQLGKTSWVRGEEPS